MTTDVKATTDASGYCSAHQEPCLQCYAGLMSRLQAAEAEVVRLRTETVPTSIKLKEPTPSPMPAGGSPLLDQQEARHQQAWGMALKLKETEHFEILNRYIAQNEATERELTKLRGINTELVATHNTMNREFCKLTEQLQVRLEESDDLPSRFSVSAFVNAGLSTHDASAALMVSRRLLEESEDAVRKQPDGQKPKQLSHEEALDAMGDEVERHPIGGHGYRASPTPEWIEEAEAAMDRFVKEPRSASEVALYDAIRWVLAGVRDELRTKRP